MRENIVRIAHKNICRTRNGPRKQADFVNETRGTVQLCWSVQLPVIVLKVINKHILSHISNVEFYLSIRLHRFSIK